MITKEIEIRTAGNRRECEWGPIEATVGEPAIGLPKILMIHGDRLRKLLAEGPIERNHGGVSSATRDGDHTFLHIDYEGQRTTYDLFKARFVDPPWIEFTDQYIGKRWEQAE